MSQLSHTVRRDPGSRCFSNRARCLLDSRAVDGVLAGFGFEEVIGFHWFLGGAGGSGIGEPAGPRRTPWVTTVLRPVGGPLLGAGWGGLGTGWGLFRSCISSTGSVGTVSISLGMAGSCSGIPGGV